MDILYRFLVIYTSFGRVSNSGRADERDWLHEHNLDTVMMRMIAVYSLFIGFFLKHNRTVSNYN